jgi:hypothetical protein
VHLPQDGHRTGWQALKNAEMNDIFLQTQLLMATRSITASAEPISTRSISSIAKASANLSPIACDSWRQREQRSKMR